jgi:hypothetical protein
MAIRTATCRSSTRDAVRRRDAAEKGEVIAYLLALRP